MRAEEAITTVNRPPTPTPVCVKCYRPVCVKWKMGCMAVTHASGQIGLSLNSRGSCMYRSLVERALREPSTLWDLFACCPPRLRAQPGTNVWEQLWSQTKVPRAKASNAKKAAQSSSDEPTACEESKQILL